MKYVIVTGIDSLFEQLLCEKISMQGLTVCVHCTGGIEYVTPLMTNAMSGKLLSDEQPPLIL